ncbi:unnamed protein product [Chironomus riparius]|uniref:Uncharacterized protein n=1 Tax=Chironomus riparius TaxID=315576 RepID=A0A9N9X0W3_9DIPT|nr:unnamed protein product [Chironomus riparius]
MTNWQLTSIDTTLSIIPYCYFIVYETRDQKLKLLTFENLNNTEICVDLQQLVQSNEFSTTHHKWTKQPIIHRKYINFHGCNMFIGIFRNSNFLQFKLEYGIIKTAGPLKNFIIDIADSLNFKLNYVMCSSFACAAPNDRVGHINNVLYLSSFDANSDELFMWRKLLIGIQVISNSSNPVNTTLLSIAICEIIENAYAKHARNVEIGDLGGTQSELVGKIIENVKDSMTVTLETNLRPSPWLLENLEILLFRNYSDFWNYSAKFLLRETYSIDVGFLVYIQDVSIDDFRRSNWLRPYTIFYLLRNRMTYSIYTYVNNPYRNDECFKDLDLMHLNQFDPKSLKWILPEIFPAIPKVLDCTTRFRIEIATIGLNYISQHFEISKNEVSLEILDIFSVEFYFSYDMDECYKIDCNDLDSGKYKIENVLELVTLDQRTYNMYRLLNHQILNIQCISIYHGQLFTFKSLKTLEPEINFEDFLTGNFEVYASSYRLQRDEMNFIKNKTGLNMQSIDLYEFIEEYKKLNKDELPTYGLYICDIQHNLGRTQNRVPGHQRFIPLPIEKPHYALGFRSRSFYNDQFKRMISRLVVGGIVDKLLENMFRYDLKDLDIIEDYQILLTLNDFKFIFLAWLFGYFVSILVCITEYYVYKVKLHIIRNNFIDNQTVLKTNFIFKDETNHNTSPKRNQDRTETIKENENKQLQNDLGDEMRDTFID